MTSENNWNNYSQNIKTEDVEDKKASKETKKKKKATGEDNLQHEVRYMAQIKSYKN